MRFHDRRRLGEWQQRASGTGSPPRLAPSRSLGAVRRGGSGRRGAALVPDDGDRLPLGEPGTGGERLIEPAVT
jgi:hypothetical protein